MYIVSLMCQTVSLSWKVAVEKADYFFTVIWGGHKNNFWL